LSRRAQAATDKKMKSLIETKMEKSDQKLDSMTVLMLHYCAGLQHCLDQEEVERLKQLDEEKRSTENGEGTDTMEEEKGSLEDGEETCAMEEEKTLREDGETTCAVEEMEEEKRSREDEEGTCGSVLENSGKDVADSELDNVHIADDISACVEDDGGQDSELNTSTTVLADRTGQTELEEPLLMSNVTVEAKVSSDLDEETVEDAMIASVDMSDGGRCQTDDDLATETGLATSHTSNVVTSSTEPNTDNEELGDLLALTVSAQTALTLLAETGDTVTAETVLTL